MRCYMLISPFRIQFHLFGMDDILCEQGTVAGEDFDFLIICRIIHLAVPDQDPHPVGSNLKDGKTTYEIMDFPIYRLQNDVIPHTESPSSRFLKGFHILQIFIALPAAKLRFLLVILRHKYHVIVGYDHTLCLFGRRRNGSLSGSQPGIHR